MSAINLGFCFLIAALGMVDSQSPSGRHLDKEILDRFARSIKTATLIVVSTEIDVCN